MKIITFFNKLAEYGYVEGDSEDDKVKKSSLLVLSIPFIAAGLIWGFHYFANGFVISGIIPFTMNLELLQKNILYF